MRERIINQSKIMETITKSNSRELKNRKKLGMELSRLLKLKRRRKNEIQRLK